MKPERFSEFKAGVLVPIKTRHGDDFAFVPDRLPPSWEPTDKIWSLLVEARSGISTLDGIGRTLPYPRLLFQPLQRREAVHSSSLEGTYATPSQLMLFELDQRDRDNAEEVRADPRTERAAWEEVYNHYRALRIGQEWLSQGGALNSELIRKLHSILMEGVRGNKSNPGQYREEQVFVGRGRYVPPPPSEMAGLVDDFFAYLASGSSNVDPLIRSFIAHYQFEAIHPFKDGNGRVGRSLLSLCISGWLKHHGPWLYLSEYFDKHRSDYIKHLFAVSTDGAWDEWITFCLEGTIRQAEDAIERCNALSEIKREYDEATRNARRRIRVIIEKLFDTPMIRVSDVVKLCKVTYPTAKSDLEFLVETGILAEAEDIYPRTFFPPKLFHAAYGE